MSSKIYNQFPKRPALRKPQTYMHNPQTNRTVDVSTMLPTLTQVSSKRLPTVLLKLYRKANKNILVQSNQSSPNKIRILTHSQEKRQRSSSLHQNELPKPKICNTSLDEQHSSSSSDFAQLRLYYHHKYCNQKSNQQSLNQSKFKLDPNLIGAIRPWQVEI